MTFLLVFVAFVWYFLVVYYIFDLNQFVLGGSVTSLETTVSWTVALFWPIMLPLGSLLDIIVLFMRHGKDDSD